MRFSKKTNGQYWNQLFGGFLVEKNIISNDDLIDALDIQIKQRALIGQLAKQNKMISGKDLLRILNAMRKPGNTKKLFGEVAVSLGLLSIEQIDKLLETQNESSEPIGGILVSMGKMTKSQQKVLLKEFYIKNNAGKKAE